MKPGDHVLSDEDAETYLALGITPRELVLLRYPAAFSKPVDWLQWELKPTGTLARVHVLADELAEVDWL